MDEQELTSHLEDKFSALDGDTTEPQVEAPAEEADTAVEQGDPVEKYLSKYQGDKDKALRAAVEAQSELGRRANEIGDLREELRQLRSDLTEEEEPEQQYQQVPVNDQMLQWAEEIAYTKPAEGAMWALQNQPALYEKIMGAWKEYDPFAAADFQSDRKLEAYQRHLQEQFAPTAQQVYQENLRTQVSNAWREVSSRRPDLNEFAPQIMDAMKEYPQLTQVLEEGTHEARVKAIDALYVLSRGLNADTLASQAVQSHVQSAAELRQAAGVAPATASGSYGDTGQKPIDAWRNEFRKAANLPLLGEEPE